MGFDLSGKRVAVLGAGKMGGILLKALLQKKLFTPQLSCATVAHEDDNEHEDDHRNQQSPRKFSC